MKDRYTFFRCQKRFSSLPPTLQQRRKGVCCFAICSRIILVGAGGLGSAWVHRPSLKLRTSIVALSADKQKSAPCPQAQILEHLCGNHVFLFFQWLGSNSIPTFLIHKSLWSSPSNSGIFSMTPGSDLCSYIHPRALGDESQPRRVSCSFVPAG